MHLSAAVTTDACDCRGGFGRFRRQPMRCGGQRFVHTLMTFQAGLILDNILSGNHGCSQESQPNGDNHYMADRSATKLICKPHYCPLIYLIYRFPIFRKTGSNL